METRAIEALSKCLEDVPFLHNWEKRRATTSDLLLAIEINGKTQLCVLEIRNNGQPRYAREAVNQILRYQQNHPDTYGIFIAPYISPRSAAICAEANVGFVDFAGNCRLSIQQFYVYKEGKPNPFTQKRYVRSLYSPKAERILRVLLSSPYKKWKTEELANEANVSLGQVSNIRKLLFDREWIETGPSGFSLTDPLSLLTEWSQNYSYRRNQIAEFYTLLEVAEFEYLFGEFCQKEGIPHGLTGFSGAARFAPMVRYQRATAYVQADLDILADSLGIKPVTSGSNINLLIPYDDGVFYGQQERGGLLVVNPIQIYLDLMGFRGRGQEAAEVILDEVIKKQW